MKLVVDTNLVFSAIISDRGKIGELLLNKPKDLLFFAPKFLLGEMEAHTEKIIAITKYSFPEFGQIKSLVVQHIQFVDHPSIDIENWQKSYHLLKDVDEKDIAFLALNFQIDGYLWTGDKKLIKGLQKKGYDKIITTDTLYSKYFEL